jgi:predicted peptidase
VNILKRILLCLLLAAATAIALPASAQVDTPPAQEGIAAAKITQEARTFSGKLANGRAAQLNYLLHVPASYGAEPDKQWPLLVFLHGSREVGRDINRVRRAILPQMMEENPDFPFIVMSPQAASQQYGWYPSLQPIEAAIDELMQEYNIDPERVYITGLSMGGYGAWALMMDAPDRFAAVAPVVGGYFFNPSQLCAIKDKPIWIFGAKRDRNVPLKESERIVKALNACGAQPKFTVFENADHDQGWELAYTTTELFQWLLAQRLGQPAIALGESGTQESAP